MVKIHEIMREFRLIINEEKIKTIPQARRQNAILNYYNFEQVDSFVYIGPILT